MAGHAAGAGEEWVEEPPYLEGAAASPGLPAFTPTLRSAALARVARVHQVILSSECHQLLILSQY